MASDLRPQLMRSFGRRDSEAFPERIARRSRRGRVDQLNRVNLVAHVDGVAEIHVREVLVAEGAEIAVNNRDIRELTVRTSGRERLLKRLRR